VFHILKKLNGFKLNLALDPILKVMGNLRVYGDINITGFRDVDPYIIVNEDENIG
jgi:hypothetical protein